MAKGGPLLHRANPANSRVRSTLVYNRVRSAPVYQRVGLTALSAFCAGIGQAQAQETSLSAVAGLSVAGSILLAGTSVAIAGGIWFSSHRRTVTDQAALAEYREVLARSTAVLSSAPDGYFEFSEGSGLESCSPGLAAILGVPVVGVNQFADLSDKFERQEFAALEVAVQGLRQDRTPFDMRVATGAGRLLHARGRVVTGTGAEPISYLIWFHDISEFQADAVAMQAQTDRAVEQRVLTQKVLDTVPFPAWRRRSDLSISWVNKAYSEAVEVDAETAVRDNVELSRGTGPNRGGPLADMAQKTGEPQSEKRRFVVGGERRSFDIIETPLEIGGTLGIARDVTGREDALGELDRHTEAHASVMDRLPSAIAIFGPDKRLSFFNEAFFRLWELDEDWLEQHPSHGEVLEVLRESRRLPEQANFPAFKAQVLEQYTSVIEAIEEQLHLPDGRTLRVVTAPHTMGGLLFIYEDVSDRLEMERSRNTLAAVQLATLDHLFEGVAVFGSDGRLQLSNSGYAKIWGLDPKFLATEPHVADLVDRCRDKFPITGNADWPTLKTKVVDRTLDRTARSARLERQDGTVVDYASVPLPDGNTLYTYFDVSDSTRIERALRDRSEALEAADRLKTEFLASVSYELRTPLNAIIGFTEILGNEYFGKLNNQQSEYVVDVLGSSQKLLALINDILDLATIESGQMSLLFEKIDVQDMLTTVVKLSGRRAEQRELTLELNCPDDIGTFDADGNRIKQVLFNLVNNYITFTPKGRVVSISAMRQGDEVVLTVADSGEGIPAGDQRAVFEKSHSSLDSRKSGAGLGLSLVKSFVELHGGHVELDSVRGAGTRVTCWLPISQPAAQRVVVEGS
jgi:signal transduction histidine kinase